MEKKTLNFKHYISLGGDCYVAMDLEKLSLKDASYPFDWVGSSWKGVEKCLETGFDGFLKYESLYQTKTRLSTYTNIELDIAFPHDFNKKESLEAQLDSVSEKYKRRIDRFFTSISEPTLFFRYILYNSEMRYMKQNHENIRNMLKKFCPDNEIIFITCLEDHDADIPNLFYSVPDKDGDICRSPILKNPVLKEMMENANVPDKEKITAFYTAKKEEELKQKKKKNTVFGKTQALIKDIIQKDYVHFNQK